MHLKGIRLNELHSTEEGFIDEIQFLPTPAVSKHSFIIAINFDYACSDYQ